ncbi:sensor histidine kinase [Microvirga aerophila]|uniref:histidine kinase n=1 Tax=Microvirga aerophila TaxID=670291 RepID=A0A512C377_9HYPH|nr:sensor histidine kinase [Microvirga aerophila]GEO18656.1 sensor histidine kinase [Microvirga aerophila]
MLRPRSITGHLRLYALALTFPILLASSFIGWAYLRQEGQRINSLAERQAQAVALQIDSRLAAFQATLNVFSASPTLLEGDMDDFRSRPEQTDHPSDVWFTVRDENGQQLLNTTAPRGARLPAFLGRGDPVIFTEGRSYTSDLIWAPVTNQWAVTLSVPVRVPAVTGKVRFALTTGVPAAYFRKPLEDVPQGWIAAINDREGKILARSTAHDQSVGKPMARSGWEITKDVPPGQGGLWQDVYTLEGTKVVGAYHRMASTGWLIGVSALPEVYEAPRRNIIGIGLTLLWMALLLALALASLMGQRITKAINVLQAKAAAMRDMKVIDVSRTSLDEVNTVAAIMRNTAQILRKRQDQQTILIQELNHRVKNTLATIQAISRMTIRNSHDMAAFEQAFSARLLALSSTHNLLTESAWSGVELRELLTKELEPFRGGPHLLLSGPAVTLTSKVAIALGMAIHEMATNATKHGAFRAGGGSVRISWSVSDGNLTLKWQERCGHPIVPPSRQGFGSRLIRQTIVRELQGTVDMIYNNNGLQATFTIHLSVDDNIKDQAEAGVDMEPV